MVASRVRQGQERARTGARKGMNTLEAERSGTRNGGQSGGRLSSLDLLNRLKVMPSESQGQ